MCSPGRHAAPPPHRPGAAARLPPRLATAALPSHVMSASDDELEPDFEDWGEDEPAPTKCLFTDTIYDSVAECLAAAATTHGLDLMKARQPGAEQNVPSQRRPVSPPRAQIARSLRLSMVGCVQLVNYVRFCVAKKSAADGAAVVAAVVSAAGGPEGEWPWRDDAYLAPVLPDDPLLYSLAAMADDGGEEEEAAEAEEGLGSAAMAEAVAEVRAMHAQMADVLSGVLRDEQQACAAASAPNGTDKDGTAEAMDREIARRSTVWAATGAPMGYMRGRTTEETVTHGHTDTHSETQTQTHRDRDTQTHNTAQDSASCAGHTALSAQAISASAGPRSGPSGGGATGHGAAAEDAAQTECGGARGGCPVGPAGKRVSLESDASYFASYSRLAIHEEMLSDAVRTDGYRHAIESNGGLLQGKVVLDVGCGSGVPSMLIGNRESAACHYELARES